MTDRVELWKSPAGWYHSRRQCSANGRPKDTRKVKVALDSIDRAKVCRCVRFAHPELNGHDQ